MKILLKNKNLYAVFSFFLKDKFPDGCGLWDAKTGMMAMLLWWAVHLVSNNMFIIFYTF